MRITINYSSLPIQFKACTYFRQHRPTIYQDFETAHRSLMRTTLPIRQHRQHIPKFSTWRKSVCHGQYGDTLFHHATSRSLWSLYYLLKECLNIFRRAFRIIFGKSCRAAKSQEPLSFTLIFYLTGSYSHFQIPDKQKIIAPTKKVLNSRKTFQ